MLLWHVDYFELKTAETLWVQEKLLPPLHQLPRGIKSGALWCRPRPAGSVCCGSNSQTHTDYRNPVEKKGLHGCSWREREGERARESPRESWPLPGQAFIAFLGTLHQGWSSLTMHRFTVGDYLLQTTKDRKLLITSKRRMLQLKGERGWTGYTPYLGGLAQTLGS